MSVMQKNNFDRIENYLLSEKNNQQSFSNLHPGVFHISQVSPQLSFGDTWQIWMWYSIANIYLGDAEKWQN